MSLAPPVGTQLPQSPAPIAAGLGTGTLVISSGRRVLLTLHVQVASTEGDRDRGLMGVTHLADDQGMVFAFPSLTNTAFWMKDTVIPLDIAFWTSDGAIVDVKQMVPCSADPCPLYSSKQAYMDSVEMASGLLARSGVMVGDRVSLSK